MSVLMSVLTALSLAALAMLAIYWLRRNKNWRLFILQILALALCIGLLHALFGFPAMTSTPTGRGDPEQQVRLVIILYVCMLLGMIAQYAFNRFEHPRRQRLKFDWGTFLAPIFASPIIFIPLLASLQNTEIELARLDATRMMVFFVAFENGFFWKEYFDHRRKEKEKNEG